MEDALMVMKRLETDLPFPQEQVMQHLKYLNRAKNGRMLAEIKTKALSNPDNTYPVDFCATSDLVIN